MIKRIILSFFVFGFMLTFLLADMSFAVSPELQETLELLKSTVPATRRRAAAALASKRSRDAVPYLIEALKDEDFGVRTNVVDALGNLRDRRAVDPLINALEDEERSVRISAVVALGFLRDKKAALPIIKRLEKDEDEGVKISAAQVLGVLGDSSAIKPLINALASDKQRIRVQAARSLGRLRAENAAGPLAKIAEDKEENNSLRINSISALGNINAAVSIRALEKLLKSDDEEISVTAASSLGELGINEGLNVALNGMESENLAVRRQAILALSHIGVKNNKVEDAIKKALKDEDSRVRRRAEFVATSLGIVIDEEGGE